MHEINELCPPKINSVPSFYNGAANINYCMTMLLTILMRVIKLDSIFTIRAQFH